MVVERRDGTLWMLVRVKYGIAEAFSSDDDGATWLGGLVLDERNNVSYPDAVEGSDGFVHVVHDREHTKAREILHHRFKEADVRVGLAKPVWSAL